MRTYVVRLVTLPASHRPIF